MTDEERARARAHEILGEPWCTKLALSMGLHMQTCDRLTAFILAAETELHRVEGELAQLKREYMCVHCGAMERAFVAAERDILALNSGGVRVTGKGAWPEAIACCARIVKAARAALDSSKPSGGTR